MASTEPRTPQLPFEITEDIIQLHLGGPYTFPDSHRPSDLAPLLLVCKGWHEYGERQLYESISIIANNTNSEAIGVARLLATLSQNSRLAELVHFFTFEFKYFSDNRMRAITRIISLLSNLTHLSISRSSGDWQGIDTLVVENFRHALAERSLKYFRLYSANNWDRMFQTDTLCSLKEMLELLTNWPDLEEFSLIDESAYRNQVDSPPEAPVRCLALRRVELQGLNIACVLAKMAPFVEDVDITHGNRVDMEDLACLHTWSETLTHLNLRIVEQSNNELPYFPRLRKLRYFYCEAPDMHPRCLESMDSLEELFYCVLREQAKQLVNSFRLREGPGDFLPLLKVLRFRPYYHQGDINKSREIIWVESCRPALKSLKEICARRNISFRVEDCQGYRD